VIKSTTAASRAVEPAQTSSEGSSESATTEGVEDLVTRLIREMIEAWHGGDCPLVEEFLARHPALLDHAEAATRLISEEIRLRREMGFSVASDQYVQRFPQWETRLVELIDLSTCVPCVESTPTFPVAGDSVGEFRLLAVLGRGVRGSVFLAAQPALASRLVVLKLTPRDGREHLSLARLQHAHIVPLYWVQDLPDRDLRVMCMPYLGGTTLAHVMNMLGEVPIARRSGRDLLDAIDQVQSDAPPAVPAQGPARQFLARASYLQAVCWIGACLADALHFAHQRDLLHLDLKPSNVLLAADGTPMLLDFHLAQAPIRPDGPVLRRLGGTPAYMSPEQWAAMVEARAGRTIPGTVDGRSDIYALGLMLYEALGGTMEVGAWFPTRQTVRLAPHVPVGLVDILTRCLAYDARDRYPDAALLAEDLRRHLSDLPLRGVANRSFSERWRKWRRRRPHALGWAAILSLTLATLAASGLLAWNDARQRLGRAEAALAEGRQLISGRAYATAVGVLDRGLALTDRSRIPTLDRYLPRSRELRRSLDEERRRARRAEMAEELHGLADHVRLLHGTDLTPTGAVRGLERRLRETWDARDRIVAGLEGGLSPDSEQRLRTDLLDLAILWGDLRVRLASGAEAIEARRDALRALDQAEALFGASPVLERARQSHAEALGLTDVAHQAERRVAALAPRTAWEHYAMGRTLLNAGALEAAARELDDATDLRPQELWGHFCRGVCAYRLRRFDVADSEFNACVALAPGLAECYYNRAKARVALGQTGLARHDYDHALELAPGLADAALNRGVLHYREGRFAQAEGDFQRALGAGADPAAVHYNLDLVHQARGDRDAARSGPDAAPRHDPDHHDALDLQQRLRSERPARPAQPETPARLSGGTDQAERIHRALPDASTRPPSGR
jgi:eukaryotic-like serine/threonine-protein kinase